MQKILLMIFSIVLFILSGCTSEGEKSVKQGDDKPVYGDTFVTADISDAVTLNPLLYTDSASGDVIWHIMNGLIKYDYNNKITGDLAETWEIIQNANIIYVHLSSSSPYDVLKLKEKFEKNKNKFETVSKTEVFNGIGSERKLILEVTYTNEVSRSEIDKWIEFDEAVDFVGFKYDIIFNLRKNVKWSDGRDFTSADVLFTYEKIMDPKVGSPRKSNYDMIKSVSAVDRHTVKVEYFKPFAPSLQSWGMRIIPKHILENENLLTTNFNRSPIGTGAYKLLQWSSDEYILLESNHNYFKGRPYIDKFMMKIIPDTSQQFLDLKNGLLDYMSLTPDQYVKQVDNSEFKERFNVYNTPSSTYYSFVGYNCSKEPFNDKRIRQALSYAIDVETIIDNIFYGYGKKVSGPFPIISWAYNPEAKDYNFNAEIAGKLLDEAGWITGSSGIREKNGKKLTIELMTNNGNKEREYMVRIIADYWGKIGIDVKQRFEEWGSFLSHQDRGEYDAVLLGWRLALDPDIYNIWHSSNIPNEAHPSSFNFARYSNKRVDELLEKARFTFDEEERKKYYWEVHDIIAEEQPYTFLIAENVITVIDRRFRNIEIKGNSIWHNYTEWYVPSHLVRYK
ncbi:MAG: peptide-binding protein [Candidatus Muiribacteriota bacterium]|jgi:peptide/nickel transport system substrate-binding protein